MGLAVTRTFVPAGVKEGEVGTITEVERPIEEQSVGVDGAGARQRAVGNRQDIGLSVPAVAPGPNTICPVGRKVFVLPIPWKPIVVVPPTVTVLPLRMVSVPLAPGLPDE